MVQIKIPSKNIYQKDNQKILDNYIDKIEVDQKLPQIISDTQNVYNERVMSGFYGGSSQDDIDGAGDQDLGEGTYLNIAYVKLSPTYITKTFTIPKHINNSLVTRLLTGVDNNGSANIKYSLNGITQNGTQTGRAYITLISDHQGSFGGIELNEPSNVTSKPSSFTLFDKKDESLPIEDYPTQGFFVAKAEVNLNDLTNVGTATESSTSDDKSYQISLTILSGLKIIKCGGAYIDKSNKNRPQINSWAQISGTYENYIPTQVSVSFYGDTLSLDLQDNTLTIGNGKNTYSFSGNELMQSTNSPSVKDTYQKVIEQYKDGKEVAEIKCNIDNYYDIENNLAISNKVLWDYNIPVTITEPQKIEETEYGRTHYSVKIISQPPAPQDIPVYAILWYEDESCQAITNPSHITSRQQIDCISNGKIAKLLDKGMSVVVNYEQEPKYIPMTFHMGDTVIPYVYTAKDIDRPMSYYSDNTPKQFAVVGKGISYSGRVYQTLTTQGILQPTTKTEVIK